MRRPSSSRYDIVTSANAWAQIGTLSGPQFQELQDELDRLAWSGSMLRASTDAPTRGQVRTSEYLAAYELDHLARRVTVLSVTRRTRTGDTRELPVVKPTEG